MFNKEPTWFQSSNPTCIDLILTNTKELFKNTDTIEVGIFDHHSLIVTALKSQLLTVESRCIALFVVRGFIKKLFLIGCANRFKSVGFPHIAYIVIH